MNTPRSTKPGAGNKYFIRKSTGGYSSCIQGSPTDPNCNVLANCVGYANGAFNELLGLGYEKYDLNCNAKNFIERAVARGLSVVQEPVEGGILVFGHKTRAGHVAFVYKKVSSTQVKTSESGYGNKAFWTATRNKGNGSWGAGTGYYYRGCIVPPGYTPPTPPTTGNFNIGDVVVINGQLFGDSNGGNPGKTVSGVQTTITRKVDGRPYPYNTSGNLGWVAESSLSKASTPTPPPAPTGLQVGDKVEIIGTGNGASDGSADKALGIGWTRYITKIYYGRKYPYQVGNQGSTASKDTTGFYKAEALRKL